MEELFRESADLGEGYFAITLAHYDTETGVLVVDQLATGPGDAGEVQTLPAPAPRRVLDTVHGRSAAIRYGVALADEWIGIVRNGVASG